MSFLEFPEVSWSFLEFPRFSWSFLEDFKAIQVFEIQYYFQEFYTFIVFIYGVQLRLVDGYLVLLFWDKIVNIGEFKFECLQFQF